MEPRFFDWNRKWGAPFGREGQALTPETLGTSIAAASHEIARRGMFSVQPNNSTRMFEYPWAYFAGDLPQGSRVLEIGGALSGFQFVLSREGHRVDNVDPGMEAFGFPITHETIASLNAAFETDVSIIISTVEDTDLPKNSYERAFSLSVIEHLDPDVVSVVMRKVHEALKPGGLFILTVDLFLNLTPFTRSQQNEWGRNIPIPSLIDSTRFDIVHGARDELYGFDEFDDAKIMRDVHQFFIGRNYPTLIQTVVLRRK